MGWKRKAGIGFGVVILLLIAAAGAANYFRLFAPAAVIAEPGPTGRRVSESALLGNFYPGRGTGPRPALLAQRRYGPRSSLDPRSGALRRGAGSGGPGLRLGVQRAGPDAL